MMTEIAPGDPIVVLTGAGVSAESGIKTFRDAGGLWESHRVEDVATPEGFRRNPALVQEFYNQRRRQLRSIAPNAAHLALAELGRRWPGKILIVTQNIDDLHERAGSPGVVHMHGELFKVRCMDTGAVHPWREEVTTASACPCCGRPGTLRPHVVWFGEIPLEMDRIHDALGRCRMFIAVGTSGQVYPAAGFVQVARIEAGARTVELNAEPSAGRAFFHEGKYGPATRVVPDFVRELLELVT